MTYAGDVESGDVRVENRYAVVAPLAPTDRYRGRILKKNPDYCTRRVVLATPDATNSTTPYHGYQLSRYHRNSLSCRDGNLFSPAPHGRFGSFPRRLSRDEREIRPVTDARWSPSAAPGAKTADGRVRRETRTVRDSEENRDVAGDGGGADDDGPLPSSAAAYDPPPARPSESDCCGSGCVPCVMDVYDEEYARWERRRAGGGGGGGDDGDLAVRRDLLSATEYKPFAIVSARRLCDDVYAYRFATEPRARGRLPIECAQHVHVRVAGASRPYTPVAVGDGDCWFDALVERRPGGLFTPGLLRAPTAVAGAVAVRGPSGPVASHRDDWAGYGAAVAFCAGTGVAAVVRLVRAALDDPACDVLVRLHYTCRTLDRVLVRDELTAFAAYWNCAVRLYLTGEPDWNRCARRFRYGEDVRAGRITADRVAEIVRGQRGVATLWLVCGGRGFGRSVVDALTSCGVAPDHVKVY